MVAIINQAHMDDENLDAVWEPIVEELATLQDREHTGYERPMFNPYSDETVGTVSRTAEDLVGGVVNPVCEYPVVFDTACAAHVFATEWHRTGEEEWRNRARRAVEMVRRFETYSGAPEPRWDPMGWHFAEGSLSVTGTVLDALWDAVAKLQEEPITLDEDTSRSLGAYLERCRHGRGRFAHNAVPIGEHAGDVQNTTAFAYYLRRFAGQKTNAVETELTDDLGDALAHLVDGQRVDGFWPYIYPSKLQQRLYRFSATRGVLMRPSIQKTLFRGDSSILFGDSVHHCYVLYYLLKGALIDDGTVPETTIRAAWEWIEAQLEPAGAGGLRFDFDWEPAPTRIRFCNFFDVTTYFLILATLPLLQCAGVIDSKRTREVGSGLLEYVSKELVNRVDMPCLPAHECDYATRRHILPAVWGGTSLKGSLLACYIDHQQSY